MNESMARKKKIAVKRQAWNKGLQLAKEMALHRLK
jgi:hypothetical protein